jgi:uncharacterized protein YjiS (DUF1127 family)
MTTADIFITPMKGNFLTEKIKAFRKNREDARMCRVTMRELNSLTDRELKDIGLNKSMIKSVARNEMDDLRIR